MDGVCPDDDYRGVQTLAVSYARNATSGPLARADTSGGVGIFGHSMGGKATLGNSVAEIASAHGLKAAVMLHAWTPTVPWVPGIPFLAFTGSNDTTAPDHYTERWYDKATNVTQRGLVDNWSGHHEPDNWDGWKEHDQYNPKLPQFVVAWFKLHLDGVTASAGVDWRGLIYGTDPNASLCAGGDGPMRRCEVHGAPY